MDRDLESGVEETGSGVEDEIFFDCGEHEPVEHNDDHYHPQEIVVVQDSQRPVADGEARVVADGEARHVADGETRPVADGEARALPGLMGHDLKSIGKIFNAFAGTVGIGLLIAFLGLTLAPRPSVMYKPISSSCDATVGYVAQLYEVVSVGLCVAIVEFLTSLLVAGKGEAQVVAAEPRVPMMRRVCIFVAAVSQVGLTICVLWSLFLAVSVRMGKVSCWTHVFSGLFFTGFGIFSVLSIYAVYIGLGCVFGTN